MMSHADARVSEHQRTEHAGRRVLAHQSRAKMCTSLDWRSSGCLAPVSGPDELALIGRADPNPLYSPRHQVVRWQMNTTLEHRGFSDSA